MQKSNKYFKLGKNDREPKFYEIIQFVAYFIRNTC